MPATAKTRLMIVAPGTRFVLAFLVDQIEQLMAEGFEVRLVCARDSPGTEQLFQVPCAVRFLNIARQINVSQDVSALIRLMRIMRSWKPDMVHTHGPKAGLLGSLAAFACGVSIRLHTIHGLRSDGLRGAKRKLVEQMERLTVRCSTQCFAVSRSLAERVVRRNISPARKISVLGHGSWAGVSLDYFCRAKHLHSAQDFRERHCLSADAIVVTCIGRLARDKGLQTLAEAWHYVSSRYPQARLLIAGPLDPIDPISPVTLQCLRADHTIVMLEKFVPDVATLLAASDIQPSFREGLGVTALEAAAMELPVVASRVTGLVDAVSDNVTGFFFPAGHSMVLADALKHLLAYPETRRRLGQQGCQFVRARFSRPDVLAASLEVYRRLVRSQAHTSLWDRSLKRGFDVVLAFCLLLAAAPLMLAVAAAIWIFLSRPVFFTQQRAGLHGKPIKLYKFRTMKMPGKGQATIGTDHLRSHWLGGLLRRLSLDELPQLFNVLRGDMSLVGPRPLLVDYLPRYSEKQAHRHDVRPGITGWAQVNGRNAVSWEHRFALDLWYVQHRSARLDLRIMLKTVQHVLWPGGITPAGLNSMPEFLGGSRQSQS